MSKFRASQAASAYRRTATVVPPEVAVVRLYDCAIVLVQRAVRALDAKRRDEGYAHIHRAASILRGLSHILDHERGGPLAERLHRMYSNNIIALYRALGKPDAKARYGKLIEGLAELRDAWATVARMPTRIEEAQAVPQDAGGRDLPVQARQASQAPAMM